MEGERERSGLLVQREQEAEQKRLAQEKLQKLRSTDSAVDAKLSHVEETAKRADDVLKKLR
jgi:hypothetical protein